MRHGREAKERPEEDGAEGVLDVHPWDEIPEVEKIGALREEAGDGAVGGRGIGGRRGHDAREEGPGMGGREGRIWLSCSVQQRPVPARCSESEGGRTARS